MRKLYLSTLFLLFIVFYSTAQTLTATVATTNTSCYLGNDGTAIITVSGGIPPYTYAINSASSQASNVFTGLSADNYGITITDAAAGFGYVNFTITDGPLLTANTTTTPTLCNSGNGGTITVVPTSGTSPYDFMFDNGYNVYNSTGSQATFDQDLYAGDYIVQFTDANGCVGSSLMHVDDGDSLRGTYNVQAVSCLGSADAIFQVNFTNGVEPYTLYDATWGLIFTPMYNTSTDPNSWTGDLAEGNYSWFVQDSIGCVGILNMVVPAGLPAFTHAGNDTSICNAGSLQLSASDNGTLTAEFFQWEPSTGLSNPNISNPIATPNATTTYIVTTSSAWSNGSYCISSDTITITVINVETPVVAFNDHVLSVTNVQNDVVYTWQRSDGSSWTDIGTGTSYTTTSNHEYRVKAANGNCEEYSSSLVAGRMASPNPYGIYTYPNPTTDVLKLDELKLADGWQTLEIVNSQGARVLPVMNVRNQTATSVNVSGLNAGVYILRLTGSDGKSNETRFIKQ